MIKNTIQKIVGAMGYRITKASNNAEDPFTVMQRLLKDVAEPVIFDVGAHVGHTSLKFRKLFPSSTIHAFEPFNESFQHLEELGRRDPSIRTHDFGLSDTSGSRDFHSNPSSATNSILATDERGPRTWKAGLLETKEIISAQFKTLDQFVEDHGIQRIDVLKLDVQGAESLVMAGAAQTCRHAMIDVIYTEIITQPTYEGQKRLDECLTAFYQNGFDLYDLYNAEHSREGRLIQLDALFIRNGR